VSATTTSTTPSPATDAAAKAGAKCAAAHGSHGAGCCAGKAKASTCTPKPGCNHGTGAHTSEPQ
jgi:hypothetical protein